MTALRIVGRGLLASSAVFALAATVPRAPVAQPRTAARVITGFDLTTPVARWELPRRLREVSGLAAGGPGRVLAHSDEAGVIVELDYHRGKVLRELRMGSPTITGDFEGIALVGHRVTLMTSDGRLFSGDLPSAGAVIEPVDVQTTGLGRRCELEGLAVDGNGDLLLPCQTPRVRSHDLTDRLTVWAWSPSRTMLDPQPRLAVPLDRRTGALHPSAVVRTPAGTILLLFGRERAIGEFAANGTTLALWSFDARTHPQPEGLAITADGMLLIADEARGSTRHGTLTVYRHAN